MNQNAANRYLTTEVMTATPQKLQLMLINAIIQAVERARKHWLNDEHEKAKKHLRRAREIVCELLNGFDYQAKSELIGKVAGVYLFIYRTFVRAEMDKDLSKLDEALRILEIERDTWRQLCEKLATSSARPAARGGCPPSNRPQSLS